MLLLDTDVVSQLRKIRLGNADPNVARWSATLDTADLFIGAVTTRQLEIGVLPAARRDPRQGVAFRQWLERSVPPAFGGRILPVHAAVARRAAQLHVPDPQPVDHAFIAATALVHGMTAATRNVADLAAMGVRLLNPWV